MREVEVVDAEDEGGEVVGRGGEGAGEGGDLPSMSQPLWLRLLEPSMLQDFVG